MPRHELLGLKRVHSPLVHGCEMVRSLRFDTGDSRTAKGGSPCAFLQPDEFLPLAGSVGISTCSAPFCALVRRLGMRQSASVRGPGDKAYAESFFQTLKAELTRGCQYATEGALAGSCRVTCDTTTGCACTRRCITAHPLPSKGTWRSHQVSTEVVQAPLRMQIERLQKRSSPSNAM